MKPLLLVALLSVPLNASSLYVYTINFGANTYTDHIEWRVTPLGWTMADQYLVLQTDALPDTKHRIGTWAIQVYTANTDYLGHVVPISGLVSEDRLERLPVIWKIIDPPSRQPARESITELAPGSTCNFEHCAWAYFLDHHDPVTPWQDNFWYAVPLNHQGAQYAVSQRWSPTYVNGWTSQLLYLATNFRTATRQLYHTTLYVEMLNF